MFDPLKNYNFDRMNNLVKQIGTEQESLSQQEQPSVEVIQFNENNSQVVNLKFNEFLENVDNLKPFFSNVEKLFISYNDLNEEILSEKVKHSELENLSKKCLLLDASHNNFSSLSRDIWSLLFNASLKILDLSFNEFSEIIPSTANESWLPKVEVINLGNNKITEITKGGVTPSNILPSLKVFNLSNNSVTSETLNNILFGNQFKNLKVLHLNSNKIEGALTVKDDQCVNTSIEEIYLDENKITAVESSWLAALPNLKVLSLAFNKISSVQIAQESKLERVNLHSNQLTDMDQMVALFTPALRVLTLHQNQIAHIPEQVGNCTSLEEITLYNNKLKSVPKGLFNLIKLETLYLQNNELTELPEDLGNLENLKELDLFENKLTTLPSSIGKLVMMKRLCLDNNDLRSIPADIINLSNLIAFSFHGNRNLKVSPYISMMTTGL